MKNESNNGIAEAYESIRKFNTIAGTLDNPTLETLDLYNSLSFEECSESIDAFESQDAPNTLKEAIDEFYVICGKLQVLEALGMNVKEGLKAVCENNLTKFPVGSVQYQDQIYASSYNSEYNVFVLKNANGKVMKPLTYKKVDLSHLVPDYFFPSDGQL